MKPPSIEELQAKIARLQILALTSLLLEIVLPGVAFWKARALPFDNIEAQRVTIRQPWGDSAAILGFFDLPGTPSLRFVGSNRQKPIAELTGDPSGGRLRLNKFDGTPATYMSDEMLILRSSNTGSSKTAAAIELKTDVSYPRLNVVDQDGQVRVAVGFPYKDFPAGSVGVGVYNKHDEAHAGLIVDPLREMGYVLKEQDKVPLP